MTEKEDTSAKPSFREGVSGFERSDMSMATTLLKAAPLFLLMAFPGVSSPAGGDEPGDGFVTIDDDDKPMVFEFGSRRGGYLGVQLLEMTPALREHFGAPKDAGVL